MPEVTQALLQELLNYEEETGKLWWRPRGVHLFRDAGGRYTADWACRVWNTRFANQETAKAAGTRGYYLCSLMGKKYTNHRLIWLLKTGDWPEDIDHIDGDRLNNKWINLRNVSRRDNLRNSCRRSDNTSGVTGVFWRSREGKWGAEIGNTSLGMFQTFDAAVEARKSEEGRQGYHTNHGREATKNQEKFEW